MKNLDLPNPALALPKPRHEALAQNLAKGMSLADAYIDASGGAGRPDSAKVAAHRIKQKPIFQQRLKYLMEQEQVRKNLALAETTDLPDSFGKDDIAALFVEVLTTLEQAYSVAQNSAVPPIRCEQLRKVMADHSARMAKLADDGAEVAETASAGVRDAIERINGWSACTCH